MQAVKALRALEKEKRLPHSVARVHQTVQTSLKKMEAELLEG